MAIFTAITAGISAISTFIGGLSATGAFLLRTAVGIGLNLLASSLAGNPTRPSFSINGELRGGGDLPRHFIIGKYMTAGSLAWANTWGKVSGTPNAWFTQVIALSDLPSKGLSGVWVDGKKVTYGSGTADAKFGFSIPEFEKGGPNLYIKFYDGTQTTADAALISDCSTPDRTYSSRRVGIGVTYAIIHARSVKNMFSGFPVVQFEVDGTRLYDMSKDSTQGGVGTQRYATPSTWGGDGDENPVVQAYNFMRGIYYGGRWLYGLQQLPASRLPNANWIAGINKARAVISGANGNEPTYRCSGEIDVSVPVSTALDTILTTCQGRIAEMGGTYMIFVGAPGSPTVSFTDAEILSTEEQEFTPFQGIADSINGVSATYPSVSDNWNVKTAPPLLRPDLEARDGGRRLLAEIELSFVPYDEQVQRLMKSALLEALRFRRHTISLPPEFWPYAIPGEVVQWTSVRNGYVNKLFRIDGATDRGNLDVLIDITEVDPSDYSWSSSTDFKPVTDGVVGIIRPPVQTVIGWTAIASVIQDNTGVARRPAITLSWVNTVDALVDVRGIRFEVRNKITGVVEYRGYTNDAQAGSIVYSQGLLPNTQYEVLGRYDLTSEREVSDSGWLSVTTLDIRLTDSDVYLPGMIEDLESFVDNSTLWIRDGTRQLILEQQRLARLTLDQDYAGFRDKQQLRQELKSAWDQSAAYAVTILEAATGPGSAMSRSITNLGVSLSGNITTLRDDLTVRIDQNATGITAVGARVTLIETRLPELNANASAISALQTRVTTVELTADGKNKVFRQTTTPAATAIGDLWFKTDENNRPYRATATGTGNWVLIEDGRIPLLRTDVDAQALQINSLNVAVGNKAEASAVSSLQTQVNTIDTVVGTKARIYRQTTAPTGTGVNLRDLWIKSDSGNIVYVCNAVGATPTWVLSEDQRIPQLVTGLQATSDAVTAISAASTTGDVATANFRMNVTAGPAGYASRIGMEARAGGSGTWRAASLFLDVPTSTSSPTRIVLSADQIAFTNGTDLRNPFVFEGGVLYLDQANIRMAKITDLLVGTSNIDAGAVTVVGSNSLAGSSWAGGTRDVSVTVAHGTGSPNIVVMGTAGSTAHPTNGIYNMTVSARAGSTVLNTLYTSTQQGQIVGGTVIGIHTPASGTSSTTFTIRMQGGTAVSAEVQTIFVQVLKR